jgi:hypothetical protein
MKNLNTNESTSFESSLGSPTKPSQTYELQKPKQLFFVNSIEDIPQPLTNTIINLGPVPKVQTPEKKSSKKKITLDSGLKSQKIKKINKKKHILDFDSLFKNIILMGNKSAKSQNKKIKNSVSKSKCKLIGTKRIRNISNKDTCIKSKFNIIFITIYMFVNLGINIKKRKIENKISSNKSKGKSNNNNNISSNHSNIYDINNFFSCAIKIREKSITHNVICPSFEELSPEFFEDNNIEVSKLSFLIYFYRTMKKFLMKPI